MKHISTKGSSGPEIAHLDYIDHYMLYCAILAIRLPLAIPRIWCCLKSFKIATMAPILDTRTEQLSNSESPCHPNASYQVSAQSGHGGHLGYWNRTILAILNFHNTPMPPIKFKLNQTYCSGADVIWRFSRWLPWWPSWLSEWNHFSSSKSPCCPDAFHQVSALSDFVREQITIKDLQDGRHGYHHGYDSDGDVENVKRYWWTYWWGTDHGQQTTA